jgi:hypothetical protein
MIRQPVSKEEAAKHYQGRLLEESVRTSKRLSDIRMMIMLLQSEKSLKELYTVAGPKQGTNDIWSEFWWDLSYIQEGENDVR